MSRDRSMWRGKPGHQPPAPGPTGKYPRGRLSRDDRGELTIAIKPNEAKQIVEIAFGTDVSWLAFGPAEAKAFAEALLAAAEVIE